MKPLLEFNKRAHVVQSATQRELDVYRIDDNFGWTPLYDGDYELGEGLTMSVISDKARLIDEAITQQHCVLSYLSKAASGECILLSITDEEGNRVATVELDCDEDLEEFSLMQCYGYRNGKVDPLVEGLVEDFVETLNEEPDEFGLDLAEAIEAEIDLDDAEDRPSNYANTLSIVPFETDAAHLSYYILDEMTPDYFSVDEFICNRGWSELFYSSKFGQEINLINRLVAKYDEQGLTPRELIKMNTDGGHLDKDALEKVLADTYSPKQQFWNQVQEICEQEDPSHEPTVETKPDVKPESPSNPKNKGMKM